MLNPIKKIFPEDHHIDWLRQQHSLKTAIACLLGILCAHLFRLSPQWVVISIFVVMCAQPRVGAVIQKSIMRLVGTFIGAIIGIIVLLFFTHDFNTTLIALILSALFFSYLASGKGVLSDGSTLGATTVAIILLTPNATIATAISRFFEISLGIIIAFLVSYFILPMHSKARLINNISITLNDLKEFFIQQMNLLQPQIEPNFSDVILEEQIINSLSIQRKLFPEIKHEQFIRKDITQDFKNILLSEREILRCISFMSSALAAISPPNQALLIEQPIFHEFKTKIVQSLAELSMQLISKKMTSLILIPLELNWQARIKDSALTYEMSTEDILHLNAFIFCAEYLAKHVQILAKNIYDLRKSGLI